MKTTISYPSLRSRHALAKLGAAAFLLATALGASAAPDPIVVYSMVERGTHLDHRATVETKQKKSMSRFHTTSSVRRKSLFNESAYAANSVNPLSSR